MTDLRCRYMGLELRSPLVASASPIAQTVEGIRLLAEGGVAAVVLPSLFEEQVQREAAVFNELADVPRASPSRCPTCRRPRSTRTRRTAT